MYSYTWTLQSRPTSKDIHPSYISFVWVLVAVLMTYLEWWTIGIDGVRVNGLYGISTTWYLLWLFSAAGVDLRVMATKGWLHTLPEFRNRSLTTEYNLVSPPEHQFSIFFSEFIDSFLCRRCWSCILGPTNRISFYHIYQPLHSGRIWHKVNFFKRSLTGLNSEFSFS